MNTEAINRDGRLPRRPRRLRRTSQAGSIVVVFIVSLIVLVGMVGFVADVGHLYVNKDRLQSAMDATALSAAMTLNLISNNATVSCSQMISDANATLASFKGTDGNGELLPASRVVNLTYEIAYVLAGPFSAVTSSSDCTGRHFVRVTADLTGLKVFFLQVIGMGTGKAITKETTASAVAGPERCPVNIVPVGVCAINNLTPPTTINPSLTCPDDANGKCYGYTTGVETCIKPGAGTNNPQNDPIGCGTNDTSGWFNWLAVNGNGASNLAAQLAFPPLCVSSNNPPGCVDPNIPNYCPQLNQNINLESGNVSSTNVRGNFNDRFNPSYLTSLAGISNANALYKLTNCWRGDLACELGNNATGCDQAGAVVNASQLSGILNPTPPPPTYNPENCVWDTAQAKTATFNEMSFSSFPPIQGNFNQVNNASQYSTGIRGNGAGTPPTYPSLYAGYQAAWTASGTLKPLNQYYSPRIVVTPVMDCTNATNTSTTPPVVGYMCAFITREIPKSAGSGTGISNRITVEFTGKCGDAPRFPIRIVLYKNISSADS